MPRHPKCAKLRTDANSNHWPEMLAFYFRQAASADVEIAREVNDLCMKLVNIMTERDRFIEELKSVDDRYAEKTVDHLKEIQVKDDQKVTHMGTMTYELDLSSRDKHVFIMKLNGSVDF